MRNKFPNLLKNILTTASALAIAAGADTALAVGAVSRTSLNNPSNIGTATDWNPNGFNSGDSLIYGGNHTIQVDGLGFFNINVIDTGANPTVGEIRLNNTDLSIGSVSSTAGGGSVSIIFDTINRIVTLEDLGGGGGISAGDYSKLETVDFNGQPSNELDIFYPTPIILPTNFLSTGGDGGRIGVYGTVTFNGTFSNTPGSMIRVIEVANEARAIFNTNVYVSDKIKFGTDGVIEFAPNLEIHALDFSSMYPWIAGNIVFQGNATVNSSIGYDKQINSITLGNGEVVFNHSSESSTDGFNVWYDTYLSPTDINFSQPDSSIHLISGSGDTNHFYIVGNLNNTSGIDSNGRIRLSSEPYIELHGSIGGPGASLENINFETNPTFRIFNNTFYVSTITTSNNGQGTLIMRSNADKIIDTDIGSESNKLKVIIPTIGEFGFSVPPAEDTKAIIKNGSRIFANNLKLYDINEAGFQRLNSSTLFIEDNTFIDTPITTMNEFTWSGSHGVTSSEVEVEANATILQDIGEPRGKIIEVDVGLPQPELFEAGRMQAIRFSGTSDNTVNLFGDLYGDNITLAQPDIVFGDDLLFDGEVTSTSTTLSLGTKTLTFDNAGKSEFLASPTVNFTVNDKTHGHFIVRGGHVDLDTVDANTLHLNLTDQAVILPPVGPVGQSYVVFGIVQNSGQITVVNDAKVLFDIVTQNPFVTWSYTNGVATRKRLPQDEIEDIIEDIVTNNGGSQADLANAINLANPANQGDAASVFQNLTEVIIFDQDLITALQTLQTAIVEAAEQISEVVDQTINNIGNRLRSLGIAAFSLAQNDNTSGTAAGDGDYKNGVWIDSFLSTVRQKGKQDSPGFRSRSYGAMIGADTMLEDDRTIGMALGYAKNKVKHKDSNEGDRSHVETYTASIYGMQEINDKWFMQGVGLFSRNIIKNKELRGILRAEVASSDFAANAYALELITGHNKQISDNVLFTTMFGVDYTFLDSSRYKETGTTNQNLLISKKSDHKLDGILGGSLSYDDKTSSYRITPELHAYITYDLLNRSPKISAELSGLVNPLVLRTVEQGRVFYNIGTDISTSYKSADFSVSYDVFLGKRYTGHQGSIKARINF